MTYLDETPVHDPVVMERKIDETSNRIARGVNIVTEAEEKARKAKRAFDFAYAQAYKKADGSIKDREYEADIETIGLREAADKAEIAFKHAERTAKALERELFARQSILNSVRAMYGAVRA